VLAPLEVLSGRCHSAADEVRARAATAGDIAWEPTRIDNVYWLNWYGRAFVERIGRDRVLATPATTLVELADGSVLWTSSPSPADALTDASRIAQAKARCHLVDEVDYTSELEKLRARSRTLEPVTPSGHADLDEVMARMANDVPPPVQSDLVGQVNVLELSPVAPGPVRDADIDDPEAEVEAYEHAAEHLVALLHDKVPAVGSFTPAELPALDAYFWHHHRAMTTDQLESLIGAVGGYLGELLVRRLGGHWVARRHRDEAAVVIGNRPWLPFARARAYLASREAAVQASLTHDVREIERTR